MCSITVFHHTPLPPCGITFMPDTMKHAPQHVWQLNPLHPDDRGGGPDRAGEDRVTENRLKGSDVWLRHMLSFRFFFSFSPEFFIFLPRNSRQRASPRQKSPLLLEEVEHVASLNSEVDPARCFYLWENSPARPTSVVWSFDSLCVWADSGLR